MKKVIAAMIVMFVTISWPLGGIWGILFSKMIGGGVEEGFIYPIYAGLILLTGLIVGCTVIICNAFQALHKKIDGFKKE